MLNTEKNRKREYLKEYVKICDSAKEKDMYGKEVFIIYDDEMLPDLFVKFNIYNNKYIDSVNFDIYANRIKKVKLKFPNKKTEKFNITNVKHIIKSSELGFYSNTWQEPCINLKYNESNIELSLVQLIEIGVKVYLIEYDMESKVDE